LALVTESIGETVLLLFVPEGSFWYELIFCFGVVAISEEGFKYLLLKRRTWRSPEFNYQFDGVVYAVFVSLGFALWENLSYVAMYGFGVAMLRAVTAVPGHACFGVFMGTWYGLAKKFDKRGDLVKAKRYRQMAFWTPAALHGSYDFIASMENGRYTWIFVVFIVVLFAIALRLVKRLSAHDQFLQGMSDERYYHW
jgi:RsiW-degrading membrane proteinase PrsW (M82 family)